MGRPVPWISPAAPTTRGANVQQWESNETSAQKWYLRQVEPQDAAPTAELADMAFDAWVEQYYIRSGSELFGYAGMFTSDFWKGAEMFEVILDAYERAGSDKYKDMIAEYYRGFTNNHGKLGVQRLQRRHYVDRHRLCAGLQRHRQPDLSGSGQAAF